MIGHQDNSGLFIYKQFFFDNLSKHFELDNLKRKKMLARGEVWQARNEPETFQHWWIQGDVVKIPLGFLSIPTAKYIKREQVHVRTEGLQFNQTLREEQKQAVTNLLSYPSGILNANTGTGKSYCILYLAATLKRKTCIVVHSTVCLKEMIEKCRSFLGVTPRVVGGSKKYNHTTEDIVVAMIHSLDKVNLFEFGTILVDECDLAVSTDIRQKLWYHCSPDYFYGFTATLKVNMQEDNLINIFFGKPETTLQGIDIVPIVKQVPTKFLYYRSLEDKAEFSKMLTTISEDQERNNLIVKTIYETLPQTETKKALVLVKRIEQAKILQGLLTEKGIESFIIIGETKEEEREKIKKIVIEKKEPVALIGSGQILGRGFDLPPLQSLFHTYPNRFDEALIQGVGRVVRAYPGKTKAFVYDFCDNFVSTLRRQAEYRRRTYKKKYGVEVK